MDNMEVDFDIKTINKINTIKTPKANNKSKLLILDLDHTIIHSVDVKKVNFSKIPDNVIRLLLKRFGLMMFVRPGLFRFIDECINLGYDIGVWSSGDESYVNEVVGMLLSHIDIIFKFSKNQCVTINIDNLKITTKPLDIVWEKYEQYSTSNTIILDDKT